MLQQQVKYRMTFLVTNALVNHNKQKGSAEQLADHHPSAGAKVYFTFCSSFC